MEHLPSFAITKGPLVSLVIPIYNVALHIERCLISLKRQTYRNIEVLIMDDCSTDDSLKIAKRFAKEDPRFRIFRMPANSGAGDTRQAALQHVCGEIIGFVDGDDWVDDDFVSVMCGLITSTSADIACCQFYFVQDNPYSLHTPWPYDSNIVKLTATEAMLRMKWYNRLDESLWNKFYRREVVMSHKMESCPFEDALVLYKYFSSAKSVALYCVPLYYYFQREGSLMHSRYSPHKAFVRYSQGIMKDRAIYGTTSLSPSVSASHVKKGLKLLREFSLLDPTPGLVSDCEEIVKHLRSLGKKNIRKEGIFRLHRWFACHDLNGYLKMNHSLMKHVRRKRVQAIKEKYTMQTMEIFKKGL